MAIRRRIALAHRFRAPASEDLFFTLDLLLDGVVSARRRARLRSQGEDAGAASAARRSATRLDGWRRPGPTYRGCLVAGFATATPGLEAAWFLATPPFALAVLSLLAGLALALLAHAWLAAAFGAGLLTLALVVVIGLIQARVGLRTWLALLVAPWYLGWKAVVQLRAVASVLRRDDYYPPTTRT